MSQDLPKTHILIVGAGPAGLTLASALAKRPALHVTVVDREPSPFECPSTTERSYTIDITGHGLKAVRYLDMVPAFDRDLIRFRGITMHRPLPRVVPWDDQGWTGSRGDILKTILGDLEAKHPGGVSFHWNTELVGLDVLAGEATFGGSRQTFDLVVAGDGAGSQIRAGMEATVPGFIVEKTSLPNYCSMVRLDQNTGGLDPEYLQMFNSHPFTVAGAVNGADKDDPHWFCMMGFNHEHIFGSGCCETAGDAVQAARRYLKKHTGMQPYISDAEMERFVQRPCRHIGRAAKCSALHGGKAVLLGDAAAAFPPIGQGINAAMESAIVLDQAIERSGGGATPAQLRAAAEAFTEVWKPEADAALWIATRWTFSNLGMTAKMVLADFLNCNVITLAKHQSYAEVYADAQKRLARLGPLGKLIS